MKRMHLIILIVLIFISSGFAQEKKIQKIVIGVPENKLEYAMPDSFNGVGKIKIGNKEISFRAVRGMKGDIIEEKGGGKKYKNAFDTKKGGGVDVVRTKDSDYEMKETIIINDTTIHEVAYTFSNTQLYNRRGEIWLENNLKLNAPVAWDENKKPITTSYRFLNDTVFYSWNKPDSLTGFLPPVYIDPTITISDSTQMYDNNMRYDDATNKSQLSSVYIWNRGNGAAALRTLWLKFLIPNSVQKYYSDSVASMRLIITEQSDNTSGSGSGYWAVLSKRNTVYNQQTLTIYSTGNSWAMSFGRGTADVDYTLKSDSLFFKAPITAGRKDTFNITMAGRTIAGKDSTNGNYGFVIIPTDTSGIWTGNGYYGYWYGSQSTPTNRWKVEIDVVEGFSVESCSLKFGDTTAVSVQIDSVYNSQGNIFDSTQVISIWNASYGKYYWLSGSGAELKDTTAFYTAYNFKHKTLPLKPNSDNFLRIITRGRTIPTARLDTIFQIIRVGNPSAGGISFNDGADTLFFRMYNESNGKFEFWRADSLLKPSSFEFFSYEEQPIYALAFLTRFKEYVWQSMREKIEYWN